MWLRPYSEQSADFLSPRRHIRQSMAETMDGVWIESDPVVRHGQTDRPDERSERDRNACRPTVPEGVAQSLPHDVDDVERLLR